MRAVHGTDIRFDSDGPAPDGLRHVRHSASGFDLDDIRMSGAAAFAVDQLSRDALIWVHAGTLVTRSQDDTDEASRGDVRLVPCGTRPMSVVLKDIRMSIALVNNTGPHAEGSPTVLRARTQGAAELVKRTVAYVTDVVNCDEPATADQVVDALAKLLRDIAIASFPRGTHSDSATNVSAALPAPLTAALAYINANAARQISLADLAAEAYATPRTVQYLFRRYLDTTPTAHLRRVRLAAAREELLTSNRSVTTVTATATKWGFGHTGRFAVLYRETYGESPHETLIR